MPKSSKKKKDKAADFSKAKLKLGKGKQLAANAVDTSFKARSIALPSQSIAHDRDTEAPTTRRRLTFDDLVAHLKHYNAAMRRDAILGLKELLEAYPELIGLHLTVLVNSCVRLVADDRAQDFTVFFSWLFQQIPPEDLIPHSPVLLLFTSSAQTHIFPEIRIDAIRFLDVFLEHIPKCGSHGRRILEGYLGILNAGTSFGEAEASQRIHIVLITHNNIYPTDSGPVQATLKSLSSFLMLALSSPAGSAGPSVASTSSSSTPTWYFSSSFTSPEAFQGFNNVLHSVYHPAVQSISGQTAVSASIHRWAEEIDEDVHQELFPGNFKFSTAPIGAGWSLQDLTNVGMTVGDATAVHTDGGVSPETEHIAHLARTLQSTLVSTLLDCAPIVFSPSSSPPETELQMMLVLGEICRSLYGALLRQAIEVQKTHDKVVEDLQLLLGYLTPYFPFATDGSSLATRDIKLEQALQDLNLIFCELTSFLVLASPASADAQHRPAERAVSSHVQSSSLLIIQCHIPAGRPRERIRGAAPARRGIVGIAPAAYHRHGYTALLPTIWSLINSPHARGASSTVLQAVAEHAVKISSTSAVKRHTVDFLGRLVLLERDPEYRGVFRVGRSADGDARLEEWVLHLPKTLWELGASNLPARRYAILRFLLRLCQRRSPLLRPETLASLRTRLVPYFIITHSTRGKLPGPYAKLPPAWRRLVLDVAFTVTHAQPVCGSEDGLDAAVDDAVKGTSAEGAYWTSLSLIIGISEHCGRRRIEGVLCSSCGHSRGYANL
ncbi:hypothetical protein B0H21DRAFT_723497 [Amylocystis lapponica]|nr:hypothetical protein B0H21DRAFT_723497 [Amylocystis lapponica]